MPLLFRPIRFKGPVMIDQKQETGNRPNKRKVVKDTLERQEARKQVERNTKQQRIQNA
jgi:hypothetical protein